jgi:hypothetical protein
MKAITFSALFVFLMVSGCGPGIGDDDLDPENGVVTAAADVDGFRILLGNAITDTLQGRASFGVVVDPETGNEFFIITMRTGLGFAGGFFISRVGTDPPQPGQYELLAPADSAEAATTAFRIAYREGMLRHMVATSGRLTFTTVRDTLIEGNFDATLHGQLSDRGRQLQQAEVHARGRFAARPGAPGYIIGL